MTASASAGKDAHAPAAEPGREPEKDGPGSHAAAPDVAPVGNAPDTPVADTNADRGQGPAAQSGWLQALKTRLGFEAAPTLRDVLEDALIEEEATASVFTQQERTMLLRILRFGRLRVDDVKVPRVDIIAIDEQEPLSALLELFAQAEVSRIPIYRETLDDPRGMIHIKDLMTWLVRHAGGKGSVAGTLAGALLLGVIFTILNFENGMGWISLSAYWQSVVRGLFLLVVVILQSRLAAKDPGASPKTST